jgi:hypothetical protein
MDVTLDRAEIDRALTDYLVKKGVSIPEDLADSAGLAINFKRNEGHGHIVNIDVEYVEIYVPTEESTT